MTGEEGVTKMEVLSEIVLNRLGETVMMGRRKWMMILMMTGFLRAMLPVSEIELAVSLV